MKPFSRHRRACSIALAGLAVTLLAGAGNVLAGDHRSSGWSGSVWVEEGFTDNLRADHLIRTEAFFTALDGEAKWQRRKPRGWIPHWLGADVNGRIYDAHSDHDFADFGPSFGYDWRLLSLTLAYDYSPHHLRVDPSASIPAFADDHDLSAEFRSKFGQNKRWTASLLLDSRWESYEKDYRERSYFQQDIEAGLRWRVTEYFTPRIGVAYSVRDATGANYSLDQVGLPVGFDVYLPAGVRGIFRYERKWRNYRVDSPKDPSGKKNNNFGRDDDVNCYETGLDIPFPWVDAATIQLRYRYRDNASTRVDRSYHVNEAGLRLVYDFD